MLRKTLLAFVAASLIGASAVAPTAAFAFHRHGHHGGHGHGHYFGHGHGH